MSTVLYQGTMSLIVVTLLEDESDASIQFECWADDIDHAREQAENAYPGCTITAANRQ
jgi:hypothetical protein